MSLSSRFRGTRDFRRSLPFLAPICRCCSSCRRRYRRRHSVAAVLFLGFQTTVRAASAARHCIMVLLCGIRTGSVACVGCRCVTFRSWWREHRACRFLTVFRRTRAVTVRCGWRGVLLLGCCGFNLLAWSCPLSRRGCSLSLSSRFRGARAFRRSLPFLAPICRCCSNCRRRFRRHSVAAFLFRGFQTTVRAASAARHCIMVLLCGIRTGSVACVGCRCVTFRSRRQWST